ncbi:peptidyl-lys metalloendopeptidase, putative, partial [Rhizoctonia solani AG-3 Rhs1AP]
MYNMATLSTYDCQICSKNKDVFRNSIPILYSTKHSDRSKRTINLCEGFWNAHIVGDDSQASGILAELPLMLGRTRYSYVSTELAGKTLATKDPKRAVQSSRNYIYFLQSIPTGV